MDSFLYVLLMNLIVVLNAEKETLLNTKLSNWKGWTKSSSKYLGWRYQSKAITGQLVYGVCPTLEQSGADYWLFSNPIHRIHEAKNLHIELRFTIRDCQELITMKKSFNCGNTFELYGNLLSKYEHEASYYNESRFTKISGIHAAYRWQQLDSRTIDKRINIWTFEWPLKSKTFPRETSDEILILGFKEDSDCIVLHQVELFYNHCPKIQSGLVLLPKTSAGTKTLPSNRPAICAIGATTVGVKEGYTNSLNFICETNGKWNNEIRGSFCHCNTGYFRLNDSICTACPRSTYKSIFGDGFCQKCPENSAGILYGESFCRCDDGFFRSKEKDTVNDKCTKPPSVPSEFYAAHQTSFMVNLSWSYPKDTGGRDDIAFNLVCVNDGSVIMQPNPLMSSLSVVVSKLKPARSYLFQLFTMNGVSEESGTRWDVMRSLIVNTDPINAPVNLTWMLQADNSSVLVQWRSQNDISQQTNSYFEIFLSFHMEMDKKVWNSFRTKNFSIVISNLIAGIKYEVKGRLIIDGSSSPFSKNIIVAVLGSSHISQRKVLSSNSTSNVSWILIGNLLLISFLLLVCLVFVILYKRQKLTYSRLAKRRPREWNNEILLQRTVKRPVLRSLRDVKHLSSTSIYNILSSSSSENSPSFMKNEKTILIHPQNLPYRQCSLLFEDFSFSCYSGSLILNDEDVSVTIFKIKRFPEPEEFNGLMARLPLLSNINCHYVCKVIGYNINSQIALIFDKIHIGTLENHLQKHSNKIIKEDVQKILRDILSAFICLFKMFIKIEVISLKYFWMAEDNTCKIQILFTQFIIEDPNAIELMEFEDSYRNKFKFLIQEITLKKESTSPSESDNEVIEYLLRMTELCNEKDISLSDIFISLG